MTCLVLKNPLIFISVKQTNKKNPSLPWKMILVLSNGATTVLATAPAKAPEKSELRTEGVCFRPCTEKEEEHLTSAKSPYMNMNCV